MQPLSFIPVTIFQLRLTQLYVAQLAGAVEFTDCISAER